MMSTISALAALNQELGYDFCDTQRKHSLIQDGRYTNRELSSLFRTVVCNLYRSRWYGWLLCWYPAHMICRFERKGPRWKYI
jgi:hypothetical protein